MRFGWLHRRACKEQRDHTDRVARLDEADRKARELEARGERVAGELHARHRRNHWGETVVEIARGL